MNVLHFNMNFLEKMFSPFFTGIFSKTICSKISCCVIWSEPDVPAAYSGVPILTDVLAVPQVVGPAFEAG